MKTTSIFYGIFLTLSGLSSACYAADHTSIGSLAPSAKHNSMAIEPKERASDYKEAFELLRKEKAPSKVCIKLLDGSAISNIIDMNMMGNSTIFLLKYNSPQGIKIQAVELELIQGIGYLE
jgi:hypothetical protein